MYGRFAAGRTRRRSWPRRTPARCWPGYLRGRIGLPPAAQAALAFAHERLGVARAGDLVLVSATTLSSTRVRVCLATPDGPYDVTVERGRVDASGLTCAAPGPAWFMAHRAVAIEPATAA